MNVVERAAKAIFLDHFDNGGKEWDLSRTECQDCLGHARAAFGAMREATYVDIAPMFNAAFVQSTLTAKWRAMIDAALQNETI